MLQRALRNILIPISSLSDRFGNWFYIGLAIVMSLVALVAISGGSTAAMKNKAYDLIMKTRFLYPAPDPDIVIVDIDEASLAAMAPDYGRWPWPRNIMGELVEGINTQKPKAIVFDITFSDPDVFNIGGDKYFREVVSKSPNTFFPVVRLAESNDHLSELKAKQLSGAIPLDSDPSETATIAVVLPYFYDVLTNRQLGTNNIYTDSDGIVRAYSVYANEYGWRIGSLPANVVAATGAPLPNQEEILINWRGKPPSYRHIPFHEIYFDMQKRKRARPLDELTGKIVIIGSTAPSLFDLKTTPVAKVHPGVEILATAADNLKKGDFLTELHPWIYILITLVAITLLTGAFVYNIDQRVVNLTFTFLQSGFLAVSYLTLNLSTVFVDLTAPFAFSLAYFAIARFNYMIAGFHRSGQPFFSTQLDPGNHCRVALAQCHLHISQRRARLALGASIKKQIALSRYGLPTTPFFKGMPLLYSFFRNTVVFYWLVPEEKTADMLQDMLAVIERAMPAIRKSARRHAVDRLTATWLLHTFDFTVDAEETWRLKGEEGIAKLFALASDTVEQGVEGVIRISATKEFMKIYRSSEGLKVSEELERAGL